MKCDDDLARKFTELEKLVSELTDILIAHLPDRYSAVVHKLDTQYRSEFGLTCAKCENIPNKYVCIEGESDDQH